MYSAAKNSNNTSQIANSALEVSCKNALYKLLLLLLLVAN